jgi:hypothetical protein
MTPRSAGSIAGAITAQHKLHPEDDATRRRLSELMLDVPTAVEPAGRVSRRRPVRPPAAAGPTRDAGAAAPEARRRRLPGGLGWAGVLLVALGLLAMLAALRALGLGTGRAALLCVGVVAGAFAFRLWPRWRRRLARPVPSEFTSAAFQPRGGHARHVLDPPTDGVDPPIEPLLVARWTTGILTAVLATERADGAVDVDRLVDGLARMNVPERIPRRMRRSTGAGAQVLVDFSDDMFPLREDIFAIVARLRRVFAEEELTVLRCAGRPMSEIGPGPRATWGRYDEMKVVPRPLLAITNFGVFDTAPRDEAERSQREWIDFAHELKRRGCPFIALVPNRPESVPVAIRRHVAIVEWDWTTTAASARRAVRG